jgi:hypothetical protein
MIGAIKTTFRLHLAEKALLELPIKLLFLAGKHMIAMIVLRKLPGSDLGNVLLHRVGNHFSDIAVFFDKLRGKGLELTDHI